MPVIGVARSDWTIEKFRARARASVEKQEGFDEAIFANLSARLHYISGDYGASATHAALRKELGGAAHALHYLAIPPSMFAKVVEGLGNVEFTSYVGLSHHTPKVVVIVIDDGNLEESYGQDRSEASAKMPWLPLMAQALFT